MEGRRDGARCGGTVAGMLLLLLLLLCRGACGLNADGVLLMSFKNAVTADPLGALAGWSYNDAEPCAWNGIVCKGFPQAGAAEAANVTLASAEGNSTAAAVVGSNGTAAVGALGLNASLAAATVSRVISLVLPNAQLSGTLPADLGRVEHLRHLDLSGNSLNGSLPATLLNASELRVLSLAGNGISGELPDGAAVYTRSLQELNLSDNALAGRLPAVLCRLPSLAVLGLATNYLAGELPIGGLGALELVDLSANNFNCSLPSDFGGSRLRLLNVSSNNLTGALPTELSAVVPANATVDLSHNNFTGAIPQAGPFALQPAAAYEGNPELCGPPLKQACSIPSSLSNPPNATDSPPAFAAIPKNPARSPPAADGKLQEPRGQEKLRPAAIVAIVAGDIAGVGLLFMLFLYAYHVRKKRRQRREQAASPLQQKSTRGIGDVKTLDINGGKEEKASTSTGCCIGGRNDSSDSSECSVSSDGESDDGEDLKKRGSFIGRSTPQEHGSKKHNQPQQQAPPAPATLVTVDGDGELEMETLLKASAYILGATGSSIVYRAVLADGTALAVRRISESGGADKLKDFEAQVRAVARFRHPNIIRLRGFYWGADEKLLIHDYAPNGSLANIAFTRRFGAPSPLHLSLEARLRIARGVARGLAYIHEKKGVHGNLKPSNILLSADMEPLVGDLGLDRLLSGEAAAHRAGASARLFGSKRSMHSTSSLPDLSPMPGPGASPCGSASAATSSAAGAPLPYQAPECLKNLRPNAKWDVYSFGIVLLELLSGRIYSEVELCQWHAGLVAEEHGRVLRMADPTLRGEAEGKEDALLACFKLAFACCAMAPSKRPAMRDAVMVLERTAPSTPGASTSSDAIP
ncbi:probable LRR receptor-like serine/threonine-protein kinase At4g37250 [Phragmites australis]|uniref:probable LRR receptor-like serine/threonine-protein kinase At4g37250 n=1 Tax=Phragmites australis TaxID=29695 RepID=UPI002D7967C2|nr:probable LRR receptor-like serine/threonine-protein kinase At4g37250 [Phragmites australis]